ncbi:WD repeat-containing protein 19, partial [Perkinsus chesapeaki]
AQYIYKLHQVLGNHAESARIAILIAKQEQERGRYKGAHSLLLRTYKDLVRLKLQVPRDLWERLMLLQSYILVKPLARMEEHVNAALLLKRICQNNVFELFRAHAAQTLASAVIECMKSGMTKDAHAYACELVKDAERRNQIPEQLRKKIEVVVRKPPKADQPQTQEPLSPCPYCTSPLPDSSLTCGKCQNIIPYCTGTGLHLLIADWAAPCENCGLSSRYSILEKLMARGEGDHVGCPMCYIDMPASRVVRLSHDEAREQAADMKLMFLKDNKKA